MSLRTSPKCVLICLAALMPIAVLAQSAPNAEAAPANQAAPAATPAAQMPAQISTQLSAQSQGGTIRGTVVAGAAGKPGGIPLPGVAVTATNTLTGKRYAAATDVSGAYSMSIPKNGRYVVRAELAGFAAKTQEVVLNGSETASAAKAVAKTSDFGLELASRAAAAEARAETAAGTGAPKTNEAGSRSGLQNLSLSGGDLEATDASSGAANSDVALPSLGGLNDSGTGDAASEGNESIAVSGQVGQTNGLANYSEDEIRQHVADALSQARASGQLAPGADPNSAIAGVLGGMMSQGGFSGGRHGFRGGSGGSGGGGGRHGFGGGGSFRNFNPAQPHGSIFYQGGNSALNSAPWSPTLVPQVNPSAYSNRFGVSVAGSPYIPGLIAPSTKQFGFLNITGQKNLNAYLPSPVRVPTLLERAGDFSNSVQSINGKVTPVTLYDPRTGAPIPGNNLANASTPLSPQALALLSYYPAPNITTADPTAYNYQTISNAGSNNIAVNSRFVRTIGQSTGSPFSHLGRGSRGSSGPPSLRQNISTGFNYSHAASDIRKIFLPLSGATESNGYGLSLSYSIGYGRLSNSTSLSWNRSSAQTRNYFTNTSNDPTTAAGIAVPNQAGAFADPRFYNGLPTIAVTNFASLSNETPSQSIHQTISVSDSVSWRHAKHNLRLGLNLRRVHADSIGGSAPLGSFSFTGYATESPLDRQAAAGGASSQAGTGSGFADFLLGLPTQTSIEAGLSKIYLRENVLSAYAQDDFRMMSNLTLNYGLRWEYFSPYVEKNNRLVNLDHNADFTAVDPVQPNEKGTYGGTYPRSLINPDRAMFAPRFGFAWAPRASSRWLKSTVLRGGYGISYNTSQYGTFARKLSFQPPFATTQTNTLSTQTNDTGCRTTTGSTTANMTLANGFGCSNKAIQNNYSVNKDYRLGMVQVYNLNIQRTVPGGVVLNVGYNGSKGSNLDVVGAPNHTIAAVTTADAQSFLYEDSVAGARLNQLLISAQQRQRKGISLGVFYQYSHSIDNASSIGGADASTVQDYRRLDLEEANSSFDVRHRLTGSWVLELPFGPNRAYLSKGGLWSHVLDGFNLSGSFTFASGSYFTPQYASSAAQELAGGNYTLRPDRVFTQPIKGVGSLKNFFNKAAFTAPGGDPALGGFGTASRNSIEGPGVVQANASLSRVVTLGESRSFEARVTANNVFNTVQYSGINTTVTSINYGQVTSAAAMRSLLVQARYRF